MNDADAKDDDCDAKKIEMLPYPLVWPGDQALRLWVFDVIHSNEYVNLLPATLDYCEEAVRWLRDGRPQATGEKVVPFMRSKLSSASVAP